nr:cation transporting ATPase C-terminal domain-containing protein [Deltaproteobacteria bacterium]
APPNSPEHLSIIFTSFVFLQIFNEINARSLSPEQSPFLRLNKSTGFLSIMVLIVIIQFSLTQFGGKLFQTKYLGWQIWLKILLLSSTTLVFGHFLRKLTPEKFRER